MNCVFITNIPAPYREPVHELVAANFPPNTYSVLFCAQIESDRLWKINSGHYPHIFLKLSSLNFLNKNYYLWSNIVSILNDINPTVIIISGFSLPMITAYIWGKLKTKKVLAFSDATLLSERKLSIFHKLLRYFFFPGMDAYIGASNKTLNMFSYYGASPDKLFQSHLCADNKRYFQSYIPIKNRIFDIILVGQFIEIKRFDFSIDVIEKIYKSYTNLSIKLVGYGPLEEEILSSLKRKNINFTYVGFKDQIDLPSEYSSAKILFFPTMGDCWGVVANEACSVGTPVITSPEAGAADELIISGINGYVLPLDVELWADMTINFLRDYSLQEKLSLESINSVIPYNYKNASDGIINAINYVNFK